MQAPDPEEESSGPAKPEQKFKIIRRDLASLLQPQPIAHNGPDGEGKNQVHTDVSPAKMIGMHLQPSFARTLQEGVATEHRSTTKKTDESNHFNIGVDISAISRRCDPEGTEQVNESKAHGLTGLGWRPGLDRDGDSFSKM